MKMSIVLLVFLSMISASISMAADNTSTNKQVYKDGFIVKIGDMAPDFTLNYLDSTNKPVKLSSLRGNVVLLQFTSSGCGVCRREMPDLEKEIWQEFKSDNFKLIGIDKKESPEKVRAFIKQTGVTYPLALDSDGKIFDLYAFNSGITRNVLIDKDGKIVYLTRLYRVDEFKGLIKKIKTLLQSYSCSLDGGC